ncbi:MAG: hypothetical protein RTU30_08055 [Candidatus Thorarchaeota archaeon]
MDSSNRVVLAVLVLVSVGIGVGFTMYYMSGSFTTSTTDSINHSLVWGVSVGDTLVYQFNADMSEGEYDLGIVNLTITDLPDIPDTLTYSSFFSSIFGKIQFDCIFANGSEIGPHVVGESHISEGFYRSFISRTILPIGDWEFLDSLFIDSGEVAFPTTTYYFDNIYYGEISGEYFIFGYRGYDMDANTGMGITVNMTHGISTGYYDYIDHDWAVYEYRCSLIAYTPNGE